MKASVQSVFGGVIILAVHASCGQLAAAQNIDSISAQAQIDSVVGEVSSTPADSLNFDGNGTFIPDESTLLYADLIDYRNYNTAFLIKSGYSIKIDGRLNFGGAKQNDNEFGSNASELIDSQYFADGFGSMLVTGDASDLTIGQYLHFSTQCKTESNQAKCADGNPIPVDSNDYVEINGDLDLNSVPGKTEMGFRTFGGNDVVIAGSKANIDVDRDLNLGGGDDQLRVLGAIKVGTDFITGSGNDFISSEFGSSFLVEKNFELGEDRDRFISRGQTVINGNLDAGSGNDLIEVRGESQVGYGVIDVAGHVVLGDGNDKFLLKSPLEESVIKQKLNLGPGDDVLDIRLKGTHLDVGSKSDLKDKNFNINFETGHDKLINEGRITARWGIVFNGGDVDNGLGDWGDLIENKKDAFISTYAGINLQNSGRGVIDNSGTIEVGLDIKNGRRIIFGSGNDQLINRSSGIIKVVGNIQMGKGDDLVENYGDLYASQGIDMGKGEDLFRFTGRELSVDTPFLVNGGQGSDGLLLNNSEVLDTFSSEFDASQVLPSGRQLIVASDLDDRFVSFEYLVQEKGVFAYRGDFSKKFGVVTLRDGSFIATESSPAIFDTLKLEKGSTIYVGMINTTEDEVDQAPIVVKGNAVDRGFIYEGGQFVISADRQDDPVGAFFVIEGNVVGAEELAENSRIVYDCDLENVECTQQEFSGLGPSNGITAALHDAFLEEGSLKLVVGLKTPEEEFCDLYPADTQCNSDKPVEPDPDKPVEPDPDKPVEPDPNKPDKPDPVDPLPGCDSKDPLCDLISDIESWKDRATDQEEAVARQVIDALIDGLQNRDIVLPMINYGSLSKLVGSGLLPRNVDAPGRSLFNYNNLLVDTVFERLPLRKFSAVEVAEVVEEEAVIVEPAPEAEPIRGLWSQTEGMDEQQAQEYLEQRVAQGDQVVVEEAVIELDGVGYVEDPSLTAQYAEREGVRAWYRAFGGDIGPTQTSILYGDYSASAGGMVLGADVSLGSNIQIGAFANYGDVSLNQFGGDTGSGSWNPNGWGGGITADYWSENFYVQGLISASCFSGSQKRNIVRINANLGDETASGEKSATSYAYALRLGAPFQTGSLLMEPQFTAAWTQNQESGFSESGADQLNLRYSSRTTNFLQTELGMKFALPIKIGERAEWVPNLRVAWLGDWDQNNGDQSIGYRFTDKDVDVPSYEEDNNGVLIEGGIDYTVANINSGSWKLYVRGGAEVWGGDRGTDWRASGGMTFQF